VQLNGHKKGTIRTPRWHVEQRAATTAPQSVLPQFRSAVEVTKLRKSLGLCYLPDKLVKDAAARRTSRFGGRQGKLHQRGRFCRWLNVCTIFVSPARFSPPTVRLDKTY